ncbi:MAG: NAD(+)/NADH kinase [Bacteroidales bacterium]|nr:NAD(+)/NADH kinase [Bacteroidales bacterium]
MKIAIFSRPCDNEGIELIQTIVAALKNRGCEVVFHHNCTLSHLPDEVQVFSNHRDLAAISPVDFLFSFGGDGTFIDAANLVGDLGIPLVGINTGRIGFLTAINKNNFEESLARLLAGQYHVDHRALLHLDSSRPLDLSSDFALNDITIRTSDDNSITSIKVWVNGKMVNTYWGDGLIIATPTGSTAYSLSCGGPIIEPDTGVNVLTPIASHTLAVRPMVIPADKEIRVVVESRNNNFSLALDSNRFVVENPMELIISKEKFVVNTVSFVEADFYSVIREKLLWGIDKRNM